MWNPYEGAILCRFITTRTEIWRKYHMETEGNLNNLQKWCSITCTVEEILSKLLHVSHLMTKFARRDYKSAVAPFL